MGQIVTDSLEFFMKSQAELLWNHLNSGVEFDLRFVIDHALTIQEVAQMLIEASASPPACPKLVAAAL